MNTSDPRQVTDPARIARLAAATRIRWTRDHTNGNAHGHMQPGGDHLLTAAPTGNGSWIVVPDADAVIDFGNATERLNVPGQFRTVEDAMRAAETELAALLRRLTRKVVTR